MSAFAWGQKVSTEFRIRVARMADRLGLDPSWLMAVMAFETGRTFRPDIKNPGSSATGLIQFMAATAIDLGTTVEALTAMSAVEQLDWVERYFTRYRGRLHTLSDVYMAVLWPAGIGKPENAVIFHPGSKQYLANKGLDIDHDGAVTKAEAAQFVAKALAEGLLPQNATVPDRYRPEPPTTTAPKAQPEERNPTMSTLAAAGLVGQLLQTVISVFQPVVRAKVEEAAGRVTDGPGAQALADGLMGVLQQVTGIADPVQATAAVTAPTPEGKAALAKVEQATVMKLSDMTPFLDQIATLQERAHAMREQSRTNAHNRSTPEGWRLRWAQATFTQRTLGWAVLVIAGLIALMQVSLIWITNPAVVAGTQNLLGQLVVLEVGLITGLVATFRDQNGFSYGGTADDNAASMARDELAARRASQP